MKLYCTSCGVLCLSITPDKAAEYQWRLYSKIVCGECIERYKAADAVAKLAREQVQGDPTVNKLMGIFGMKGKP